MHARLLAADPRVELAGVVDTEPQRQAEFRKLYGGAAFGDLDQALAWGPDAVFLCTPNVLHADAAIQALERGVAVFCEKPMATSAADARRVRDAAARPGARLQVGHNRRFSPAYAACRNIILNCAGGTPLQPHSASIIKNDADLRTPAWSADPAITGGLLYDGAIHALDAALWLLGPAVEVYCAAHSGVYPDLDNLALVLRFASGAVATVSTCGHASALAPTERLAIYGDHQAVVLEDMERVEWMALDRPPGARDYSGLPPDERWGYTQQDRAFVDTLDGAPPAAGDPERSLRAPGAEEGCRVVELIDACYRSARENRPVLLG